MRGRQRALRLAGPRAATTGDAIFFSPNDIKLSQREQSFAERVELTLLG
jgi:hypothetical protein